ncbi:Adenosine-deaminase domain containing protein [Pyrenophora tritici-repentis]|uniref:Adenosine-deaminase domain containing protein n=3 Tax=Pyrenophora tritici-repentis TaxID=45151 RepID=A0A317AEB1_9PLEO|nr:Adenosine-deaminase domain containing protein [Pyrenophora tritici-repentis]KAI1687124.1 Adenosine-deaminase domain containing protein [Pyrenophora tritici-repentis]
MPDATAIADCVLEAFDRLPDKRKPRSRNDGSREWVPLAGIVTTGMKCLPSNKLLLAHGNILHDWHAEIVAIRAFNRYLLDECILISTPPYPISDIVRQRVPEEATQCTSEQQPFTIREDVTLYMYCSEAPCGDASMELTMALQENATPWTSAPPTLSSSADQEPSALRGRSNFSLLGIVRAKPSRPDAPPTLSKSCTDKLAAKQATSLLSSTTSLLISPRNAYLESLVLPSSQYVPEACTRAFSSSGRLRNLTQMQTGNWKEGYRFQPFNILPTEREFTWSRRAVSAAEKAVSSNLSAVWTPSWQETLIGGVLQGRKQMDPRGASRVCRRGMWMEALRLAGLVGGAVLVRETLGRKTYEQVKGTEVLGDRKQVKDDVRAALKGWIRNTGDDAWYLEEPPQTLP